MKNILFLLVTTNFLFACGPGIPPPRDLDWEKEWDKNKTNLKKLNEEILLFGNKKFKPGNNDFSSEFEYPFDDGYYIQPYFNGQGKTDSIDVKHITITYFLDRGLLDHYSGIIFSNDSAELKNLQENVKNGGNDFNLGGGWYMIND